MDSPRWNADARVRLRAVFFVLLTAAWFDTSTAVAGEQAGRASDVLKQLSLEALGNVEVSTASKSPEEARRVPAAITVITQEDIRRSGVTSLPEALRLAP